MKRFTITPIASALLIAMGLSACASNDAIYAPDSLPDNWMMSAPAPRPEPLAPPVETSDSKVTSLWSSSPKSLFGDRRASQSGDILTVLIEIDDEAEMKNSVNHNRNSGQDLNVNALFGLPEKINGILPAGASLSPAIDVNRNATMSGNGNIKREEKLTLRLAARVVDVLPNGYLRLAGRQEIMVNDEVRYLQVTGLARTQDITRRNTITYDKIADARIYYGGQGQISDELRPRAGEKVARKIIPF